MLVIVGTIKDAHSLRSQVGIGSESDNLIEFCGFQIRKKEGR